MHTPYIVDGLRTPIGSLGGSLASVRADDLAASVISALGTRHSALDWGLIADVILGCANQAGEDNRNVGRMAALLAGVPPSVAGETVNRLCASGLAAVANAARAIMTGRAYVALDDVKSVALPVLRHRIMTNYIAEADGVTPDDIVERLLKLIPRDGEKV